MSSKDITAQGGALFDMSEISGIPPSRPVQSELPIQDFADKFRQQINDFTLQIKDLDYRTANDEKFLKTFSTKIVELYETAKQASQLT